MKLLEARDLAAKLMQLEYEETDPNDVDIHLTHKYGIGLEDFCRMFTDLIRMGLLIEQNHTSNDK